MIYPSEQDLFTDSHVQTLRQGGTRTRYTPLSTCPVSQEASSVGGGGERCAERRRPPGKRARHHAAAGTRFLQTMAAAAAAAAAARQRPFRRLIVDTDLGLDDLVALAILRVRQARLFLLPRENDDYYCDDCDYYGENDDDCNGGGVRHHRRHRRRRRHRHPQTRFRLAGVTITTGVCDATHENANLLRRMLPPGTPVHVSSSRGGGGGTSVAERTALGGGGEGGRSGGRGPRIGRGRSCRLSLPPLPLATTMTTAKRTSSPGRRRRPRRSSRLRTWTIPTSTFSALRRCRPSRGLCACAPPAPAAGG